MATISNHLTTGMESVAVPPGLPPLEPGDHLDQRTFHARYEAMGDGIRAELIGGVVYMPSPARRHHGKSHAGVNWWLTTYEAATPGTEALVDATTILGADSEPQPDGILFILPERGGRIRFENDYVTGSPDLAAEIGSSTESYDLHSKLRDYERAGVQEYLVVALRQQQVFWFRLQAGKFVPLAPSSDGILRSEVFPGLWLDPAALLKDDKPRLLDVLRQGLATSEHAAFVKRLAETRSA